MCGMTGWIGFDRDPANFKSTIELMNVTLAHRGPDDAGVWLGRHAALAHRRLAVIDLEGGKQPMVYRVDGEDLAALVFTGEVYNFQDLRTELAARGHRFDTRSDTEVILRGYVEWGDEVATHLDGMFAFALWNTRNQQLLLVRDRLGIKPLYYYELPDGLLFASEPKAILASGLVEPAVDGEGLCELLSLVRTPGEAVFRGMKELRPGTLLRVRRGGQDARTYWKLQAREHRDDLATTIHKVRDLLGETVRRQLVSDVPLCCLTSGGLDSSLVTAVAQQAAMAQASRIRSFTVGFTWDGECVQPDEFRKSSDTAYVRQFVEHARTEHTDIAISTNELASPQAWRATLEARDLPPLGDMDTSLYLMCKAIRQHSTVALSGEGADELFGGYAWFHNRPAVEADTFPWLVAANRLGRQAVFEPRLRQLDVTAYQAVRYQETIADTPSLPGETGLERRMRQISYAHLTRFLPIPLDRKDRLGMSVGLEIRVPYCDHRLVEYVFNVPWSMKTFDGREKSLLRAAAGDLLPMSILQRAKTPFPAIQDPEYHGRLRNAVSELLAIGTAPVLPILNRPTVRALAAMPPTGAQIVRLGLERILRLNQWLECYRIRIRL